MWLPGWWVVAAGQATAPLVARVSPEVAKNHWAIDQCGCGGVHPFSFVEEILVHVARHDLHVDETDVVVYDGGLFPTAIGSEPQDPLLDSKDHWQNVMRGHAAANQIPVIASNRIGTEVEGSISVTFYGSSFIANHLGNIEIEMNKEEEGFVFKDFNFSEITKYRQSWGNFRDRRTDLYKNICDF